MVGIQGLLEGTLMWERFAGHWMVPLYQQNAVVRTNWDFGDLLLKTEVQNLHIWVFPSFFNFAILRYVM